MDSWDQCRLVDDGWPVPYGTECFWNEALVVPLVLWKLGTNTKPPRLVTGSSTLSIEVI